MKTPSIYSLILSATLAATPIATMAQADSTQETTSPTTNQAEAEAEAKKAADKKAARQAAAREFNDARKALRMAKTNDASNADLEIINTAAAAGNTSAMIALADYLLSRDSTSAVGQYQAAISAGDTKGLVRLAQAYWAGKFVEKDRSQALSLMKQAAESEDSSAIIYYASWLPDMDKVNGVEQAVTLIENKADLLDPEKTQPLLAQIRLKGEFDFNDRASVADWVSTLPENGRDRAISNTLRKDKNLYVWLMQDVLTERGHYSGSQNGLLTSSTIRGFSNLCSQLGISSECVRGPLNRQSATAIANALKADISS